MFLSLFQVLNEFFHNVCELDLVFNFYKVKVMFDFCSNSSLTLVKWCGMIDDTLHII